jgi:hypothetical protein
MESESAVSGPRAKETKGLMVDLIHLNVQGCLLVLGLNEVSVTPDDLAFLGIDLLSCIN